MALKFICVTVFMLGTASIAAAQSESPAPPQLKEMLARSGHSPSTEEIQTAEAATGVTDPAIARDLLPSLKLALAHPDPAMRTYGLATLIGMETLPDAPGTPAATPGAPPSPKPTTLTAAGSVPAVFKPEVARALLPLAPAIASRLTDDVVDNRILAAGVLGGFAAEAGPTITAPLLAYLRRDDACSPVGLAVVGALLQLGPISNETAAGLTRYLRRSDQTTFNRTELVEAIATQSNQSPTVNQALLGFLDSDDANLRARVILSLPQLEMAPDTFTEMKTRVTVLASGNQDTLPVVNAAKSVVICWTSIKMVTGCPIY